MSVPPPAPSGPSRTRLVGLLFTRANRPFTLTILAAVVALAGYAVVDGSSGGDGAPGTSSTTSSTAPADATTLAVGTTAATTPTTAAAPSGDVPDLTAAEIASGFVFPTFVGSPPGDDRIFVAERAGVIRVVDPGGSVRGEPFLDLSDRIDSASGVELGLLGMAFHPDFASNGRFFVYYTDLNADTIVAEYAVTSDPDVADPDSESVLLYVDQVGFRHRGGMLQFGPAGYLWIGLGDGTDMNVHPQNLDTLQGSILRIDVDGGSPYAIPPDNPFADAEGRGEIWAYGLRNPWRFDVDGPGGRIYIGDVGEESWEEVDTVALSDAGANFGWPLMEGSTCFTDAECGTRTDLVRPVVEYSHEEDRCAVSAGYVYRGAAIPGLTGHFFYADWCTGSVYSFFYDGSNATRKRDWSEAMADLGQVSSFGLDGSGELLIVTSDDGILYRIEAAA
jgi:glucose/arabinose dehydrogenase